jgi:hypothetical protein
MEREKIVERDFEIKRFIDPLIEAVGREVEEGEEGNWPNASSTPEDDTKYSKNSPH